MAVQFTGAVMTRTVGFIALGLALVSTAVAGGPSTGRAQQGKSGSQNVSGAVRKAELYFTHFENLGKGFRVADDFYLPISQVEAFGWSASVQNGEAKVIIDQSLYIATLKDVNGLQCLSVRDLAAEAGAIASWTPGFDRLEVSSALKNVRVAKGSVSFSSTLPLKTSVSTLSSPSRVVLDIQGAKLGPNTKLDVEPSARICQFKPNTVRVVLETSFVPDLTTFSSEGTPKKEFSFDFNPVANNAEQGTGSQTGANQTTPNTEPIAGGAANTIAIGVDIENANTTLLSIKLPPAFLKKATQFSKKGPDAFELFIPQSNLQMAPDDKFESEFVAGVNVRTEKGGTFLTFQLTRAMGVELWASAVGVQVQLVRPTQGGSLAGKIVVIDAGHGGSDSGCKHGTLCEKHLTLPMAKYAAAELSAEGATVLMTRREDTYPSLDARCELANKNKADFFISIHINSPGRGRASPSGSQTYYHKKNPIGKLLAECIHRELLRYGKLPDLGYRSDSTLYSSGLKVLRDTKAAAVLIECGFISHPTDRARMQTKEFQQGVGKAIVQGLKTFLGQ
jgi:N-acetylmuramoyl-L-alanine amidase